MAIDLTTITLPFGLLDKEMQQALKNWEGEVEYYSSYGEWKVAYKPLWANNYAYRAKSTPLTKPSINWDHVAPEWKWLYTQPTGNTYLSRGKPKLGGTSWLGEGVTRDTKAFASFTPGTCYWEDSLVAREQASAPVNIEDLI